MDTVLRATFVYLFLLAVFRVAGKRTLANITTFDLVLTLILSEAVQQAMIVDDYSVINAVILICTLVGLDILFSLSKRRLSMFEKIVDGVPVVIVEEGRLRHDRMQRERVDESDILEAARELQGLARLDQIKYAVLETSGHITVVPK